MKEITRINHIGLRVKNLEISQKFYELLGFKYIAGPVGPEPAVIIEHPCGVNINFILNASQDAPKENILMKKDMKYPGYTHIALEVTDADFVSKQLESMGLSITERVEINGAKFFFIRDPDDNVLEFHQPAKS
ncbi:MAG: VOC family protein [Oceanospirillaceae bacterium]